MPSSAGRVFTHILDYFAFIIKKAPTATGFSQAAGAFFLLDFLQKRYKKRLLTSSYFSCVMSASFLMLLKVTI